MAAAAAAAVVGMTETGGRTETEGWAVTVGVVAEAEVAGALHQETTTEAAAAAAA